VRIRAHQPAGGFAKVNVTPLIDVVMVLIVFYLIVGKLAADRLERVDLPASATGRAETSSGLVINVVARGDGAAYVVDGRELTPGALADVLRAAGGGTGVHLRADRRLSFERVRPVLAACREAGITSVKLVAERAP
jgi:biopolymer transport protein ExbD